MQYNNNLPEFGKDASAGNNQYTPYSRDEKAKHKLVLRSFFSTLKKDYKTRKFLVGLIETFSVEDSEGNCQVLTCSFVESEDLSQRLYYTSSKKFFFRGEVPEFSFGGEMEEFELAEDCLFLINSRLKEIMQWVANNYQQKQFTWSTRKGGKTSL